MRPTPGEVRERDRDRQRLASLFMVVGSAFPLPARAGSENTFDSSHDLAHEGQSPPDEMSRTPLVVRASSAPLDDSAGHPAVFSLRVIRLPIAADPDSALCSCGTPRHPSAPSCRSFRPPTGDDPNNGSEGCDGWCRQGGGPRGARQTLPALTQTQTVAALVKRPDPFGVLSPPDEVPTGPTPYSRGRARGGAR